MPRKTAVRGFINLKIFGKYECFLQDKVKDGNVSATIYRALARNRLQNSAILSYSGLYSLALKEALKAITGTHIKERTVSVCVCVCVSVCVCVCVYV
jgi:hypothetical protein